MEEILAVIVGAGALALSPSLAPAVRPVAKSAIKSGLAVAGAAKDVAVATRDAAVATGEQCRDAVTKASEALKPGAEGERRGQRLQRLATRRGSGSEATRLRPPRRYMSLPRVRSGSRP